MISVIIINYNSSIEMLDDCIASYLSQRDVRTEIILYDNNSKNRDELNLYENRLKSENSDRDISFLYSKKNLGFAKAVNNAVKASKYEYVFISNFDIQVKDDALKIAFDAINKYQKCGGIASKVYFMHDKKLLDNVGTGIDSNACAFNRGVGLYDLGQYDIVERVFGVCFGACLLKKELFDRDKVGPLDESYFMYYEDVDWCYRANVLGYTFYSAPGSIVYHYHSQSVRNLKYGFKYKLVERNLLFTVIKNFQPRHMFRIVFRRSLAHAKNMIKGSFRLEIILIYLWLFISIPRLIRQRLSMRHRRVVDDFSIFFLSYYEVPFFVPMEYSPILSIHALMFIYKRLYLITEDKSHFERFFNLETLNSSNLKFNREFIYEKLSRLFKGEPEEAFKYIEEFRQGKGIF